MPKPTWFDWLTVAAIVLGPVFALSAQRLLDWLREKRNQRVQLFMTLMATRGFYLSQPHVQALNSIDVIFNRPRDKNIREAWRKVLEHAATPATTQAGAPTPGWFDRYNDLKVDLFQAIGSSVGYEFTADYLKRQIYAPQSYAEAEVELLQIRHTLVKVLTEDGLKVRVVAEQNPEQTH